MDVREAVILNIFAHYGWTVVRAFSGDGHAHWKAYKGENEEDFVMATNLDDLLDDWSQRNDVLEQVFNVKIKEPNNAERE